MDKTVLTEAMKASISEVLEQMFFMPIDFIAPEKAWADPEPDNPSIFAKLGFSGSPCGIFMLRIPCALAQSVSADFLGTAPQSLSQDQITGTVLEMVNMLAGSTLSFYDHRALFDLQIPELLAINDARALAQEGSDKIVVRIQTPENRMTFQVVLQ